MGRPARFLPPLQPTVLRLLGLRTVLGGRTNGQDRPPAATGPAVGEWAWCILQHLSSVPAVCTPLSSGREAERADFMPVILFTVLWTGQGHSPGVHSSTGPDMHTVLLGPRVCREAPRPALCSHLEA